MLFQDNDCNVLVYSLQNAETRDFIDDASLFSTVATGEGGDITDATNASPIVIASNAHGLSNGDVVAVYGVKGNLAANGTHTVANATTNTFELIGSTGDGDYVDGGKWLQAVDGAHGIELTYQGQRGEYSGTIPGTAAIFSGVTYSVLTYALGTYAQRITFLRKETAMLRGA